MTKGFFNPHHPVRNLNDKGFSSNPDILISTLSVDEEFHVCHYRRSGNPEIKINLDSRQRHSGMT